ncbi:hypothetical protein [Streptomyces sp. 6N223]|uniref:hypothetical protein n=1 Tax=Streptomyces sp. 6N223 TaxID=3457412 RepID=UPI003FD472F1
MARVRRWVRAFLAQAWEGCVVFGRLSARERPAGSGSGTRPDERPASPGRSEGPEGSEGSEGSEGPARSGPPQPGHPERVPPADETTPESLAFWEQVHRLGDEILPRGPRDDRGRRR